MARLEAEDPRYGFPWTPERRYPVYGTPDRELTDEESRLVKQARGIKENEYPLLDSIATTLENVTPLITALAATIKVP